MPGSTTELNLQTAVDSDDNADYLVTSLANSLRTVDALFNNASGHTHSGAHQGGPIGAGGIPAGSITSAMIADGSIQGVDIAAGAIDGTKCSSPLQLPGGLRFAGSLSMPIRVVAGVSTNDIITATDVLVTFNCSGAPTTLLPPPAQLPGRVLWLFNLGTPVQVESPSGLIYYNGQGYTGTTGFPLPGSQGCLVATDGANYVAMGGTV